MEIQFVYITPDDIIQAAGTERLLFRCSETVKCLLRSVIYNSCLAHTFRTVWICTR